MLASASARIDAADTAGTLHDRLAGAGATLMVDVLAALARGEARETPQPAEGATYAKKLKSRRDRASVGTARPPRWTARSAACRRFRAPGSWRRPGAGRCG